MEPVTVFDRRQRHFPSGAHRVAWYLRASLLPFSECLPAGLPKGKARKLAQGQRSLHEFLSALYTDMYQNPGDYRMTESPDLHFNDGEWYKARPDMTKAARKNAHVTKSLEVLFEIGRIGTLDGDKLVMSPSDLEDILAAVHPKSISRPKIKGFLNALGKFGLEILDDDEVTVRSSLYPDLLIAMKALCEHGGGEDHQTRFFAFHRCDFTAVEQTYEPDISQVLWVLPDDQRQHAEDIIAYMTGAGYKMQLQLAGYPSTMWTVAFSGNKRYKAGPLLSLGFSILFLNMFHVSLHCINPRHLIPIVYGKGSEYIDWFDRNWNQECTGCGFCKDKFKNPGPYLFENKGKKRGLCHQNWIGYRNPGSKQALNMLKMVALHTEAGMI